VKGIRPGDVVKILALALVYVLAARLGLAMDAVAGFATLVWPPSGIALAAVLLFGYRIWPGIALGAVVANALTGAPMLVALGIGIGNTLEALLAAYALQHVPGFRKSLDRVLDVFALLGVAVGSTLIGATLGVTSLYLGGIVHGQVFEAWRAWWVGDFVGDLIVGSLVLVWASPWHKRLSGARWIEVGALVVATVLMGSTTLFSTKNTVPGAIIPVMVWATLRFGARGAVTAAFGTATMAIWGVAIGVGPFLRPHLRESLLALQIFVSVVTATALVLAAAMDERYAALDEARRARASAEQANRAKAEFLAVMSHELRTPLNAIAGYVDLLALGTKGSLNEQQLESLERVRVNQAHLTNLINDVLSFARLEAGPLPFERVPIRVIDAIDELNPLIQPDVQRKQLDLVSNVSDPSLAVCADPQKLRQILLNLLSNAVKFTDDGGRIAIDADASDGRVHICVTDSGVGIPAEHIDKVFDPFYQVEGGTKRRFPGIGLGLTIARNLARGMQGDIVLQSEVGVGTKAAVVLPSA